MSQSVGATVAENCRAELHKIEPVSAHYFLSALITFEGPGGGGTYGERQNIKKLETLKKLQRLRNRFRLHSC